MKKILTLLPLIILSGCQKKTTTNIKDSIVPHEKKTELKKQSLPAGLKMEILQKGADNAPIPEIGNTVAIHYTGWIALDDNTPGRKIDSSIERNEPLEFTVGLGQVIKGFEEGIKRMKLGEKSRLFIDSELGYGKKGIGLFIPPDSNLIFDVELVTIR